MPRGLANIMATALSRRSIATYVAQQLLEETSHAALVDQLAAYLLESGRTRELGIIMRDVQHQLAQKGYVIGTITTAHEIDEATKNQIEAYTKQQTRAAKVILETAVDPRLLGGLKLSLPGQELNTTIARNLTVLKTQHKKA